MDFGTQNANNLISKDKNTARSAANLVVNNSDIETFKILCEKSDFIFDFIKEKIIQNLCFAVNSKNLSNTFNFTKIYNQDFEDFIVQSWINFADEDLTDKILELFENGTNEQKTYAAAYFYHINDPLAIEYLNNYAFSEFEPLAQNCARTLKQFNDKYLYNKAIEIIKNESIDDFEKYKYVNFLTSFGEISALDTLIYYLKHTFTKSFAASNILYLTNFSELIKTNKEDALNIFDVLIGAYPEEISLDTIIDFEVFDFIKYLMNQIQIENNSFIKRLLLKTKYKFNLISREDIYTFDLNKQIKKEISSISNFINTSDIDLFEGLENELYSNNKEQILETFDVILNFGKTNFAPQIAKTIEVSVFEDVIAEGIRTLKVFGKLDIVNKDAIITKVQNENLKALITSYFSN